MIGLELALRLAGCSLIGLAAMHLWFPKHFRWVEEFSRVSLLNRQIFYVHCFFLCLVLVAMGALCALAPEALLTPTPLGRLVSSGLVIFWLLRLVVQWFVFDHRLWRGKPFETAMHIGATILWSNYVIIFTLVLRRQW